MPQRKKTDPLITEKRVSNDIKVLRYLVDNWKELSVGKLESPEKLMVFYAGYTAMRSVWDAKTRGGKDSTGCKDLDNELVNESGKLIFRMNVEVSHSIGIHSKTLLRVATFKYWAKRILTHWG